ncbi:MAG TPA: CDP-6-deoxy-delta-3,4-glucoseen reductase [Acidiferrobacterales bacterium]|nr:CDP-6-deoxy-delta-3,4-glucoseen reductase [Acidiferrobacterales bacterium]
MSFKVHIESSGHEFHTQDGETILAAALREGLRLPYSCRDGRCGSCKGTVLSGRVDYGDYEAKALSAEEKAQGKALFCQAVPLEDVMIQAREIEAAKDIAIKILPCRVVKLEKLAHDVMVLYLKLPQQERLQFLAGQYIDILLRDGRRRSFSIANAPHDDAFLQIHIRHVPGGHFSDHVFTQMQEKALLRFEGPLGTFFLRENDVQGSTNAGRFRHPASRDTCTSLCVAGAGMPGAAPECPIILMAGGTGFAPIKGILEHAFHTGVTLPLHLFWGVRARRDLYLHELALSWERSYPNFHYTPVLSEPLPEDQWPGRTGWVHEAVARDYPDLSRYEIYASGPPPMIEAGKALFTQHRLLPENLYFDSFEFAKDPSKNLAR